MIVPNENRPSKSGFHDLTWRHFHQRDATTHDRLGRAVHRASHDLERRSAMLQLREWRRDAPSRRENHVMLLVAVDQLSASRQARRVAWTELCRT